jgi:type II secretory ATPase GspE/PulE/Tfp pilus assembly ATPase PilB-like protein
MDFTETKILLSDKFDEQLNDAKEIYADSKINNTRAIDAKMKDINITLKQLDELHKDIQSAIEDSASDIQIAASGNDIDVPVREDHTYTADQRVEDAQALFDQHRILLLIKAGIVLLILVKGNSIYAEYKQVFVGASLACIFSYLMFLRFA